MVVLMGLLVINKDEEHQWCESVSLWESSCRRVKIIGVSRSHGSLTSFYGFLCFFAWRGTIGPGLPLKSTSSRVRFDGIELS